MITFKQHPALGPRQLGLGLIICIIIGLAAVICG